MDGNAKGPLPPRPIPGYHDQTMRTERAAKGENRIGRAAPLAWLAVLMLLAAAPASAYSPDATLPETRVGACNLEIQALVGADRPLTTGGHQGYAFACGERAVGACHAARGSIRVASGAGGEFGEAVVVRTIGRGERIAALVNEAKALTFQTGREHALVKLATGERVLVSGGTGGITFAEVQITRIFGHTHPYHLLSAGPSATFDIPMLEALRHRSSYLLERGVLQKFSKP